MWDAVARAVADELAAPDAGAIARVGVRLLVAVVLAALVGYERERRGSTAGLRTHMLVALGVALTVQVGALAGFGKEQEARVLQGLIAGVGFLGAGAIIKQSDRDEVRGLTTAASVWATAAIAAAAGMGLHAVAVLATVLALVILALLLRIERRIGAHRDAGGR